MESQGRWVKLTPISKKTTEVDALLEVMAFDQEQAKRHRARFEANIKAAHEAGASTRLIARAAGLSHQRVHQIIHGR